MKYRVLIPARYASTRFPGKPLALLGGREMILHVCDRVSESEMPLCVATDDSRIYDCVTNAGYEAVMTSDRHKSGTDRLCEAVRILGCDDDVIINVQGDEPFIRAEQLLQIKGIFERNPDALLATLIKRFEPSRGFEALFDPNLVKVVTDDAGKALYFSRSIIPYVRNVDWKEWLANAEFHTHIGIYGYRRETLLAVSALPQSTLEKAESLEQLRWLQNGYDIYTAVSDFQSIGIDTEADLREAEKILGKMPAEF